jgi:hypothetical protein
VGVTGYDDGKVACTGSELVIRHYYFPVGAKRIPYAAIREVRRVPLRLLGGMADLWQRRFRPLVQFRPPSAEQGRRARC